MPKHIFLCRHAHTPEALANQQDFDRELSAAGMQEAAQTGAFIKSFGLPIDEFICSAAVRAHQTAQEIARVLSYDLSKIKPRQDLYYPTINTLFQVLTSLQESVQTVILVSHNPAVSRLVSELTGSKVYVPTSGCNFFISEAPDWLSVEWSSFRLKTNY